MNYERNGDIFKVPKWNEDANEYRMTEANLDDKRKLYDSLAKQQTPTDTVALDLARLGVLIAAIDSKAERRKRLSVRPTDQLEAACQSFINSEKTTKRRKVLQAMAQRKLADPYYAYYLKLGQVPRSLYDNG